MQHLLSQFILHKAYVNILRVFYFLSIAPKYIATSNLKRIITTRRCAKFATHRLAKTVR